MSNENKDSKFIYDVCFGFKPAKFEPLSHDQLILDEENEVTDLYFIQEGTVGIGYYLMSQWLSKKQFEIGIEANKNNIILDYYVCYDKKSEFVYLALTRVQAIFLSKKFLREEIFRKYP